MIPPRNESALGASSIRMMAAAVPSRHFLVANTAFASASRGFTPTADDRSLPVRADRSLLSINFRCGLGGGGRHILIARANRSGLLAYVAQVQQPSDKFACTRPYRGRSICRASVQTPRCPASRGKGVRRRSEHLGDQGAQFPARLGPRFFCPLFSLPTICIGARTPREHDPESLPRT
jgi:hypothetical protein